jgi:phage gp36-like protein
LSQYATIAEFDALGLPPGATSGLSTDQKTQALEDASAEIDTYLRDRGSLPLSAPIDTALRKHTVWLAAYDLLMARGVSPPTQELLRTRREDAIRWCENLARGRVVLDLGASAGRGGASVQSGNDATAACGDRGW